MNPIQCSLLVVDDEHSIRAMVSAVAARDFAVATAASAEEAKAVLAEREFDIVLTDQMLPGESGVVLLSWVKERWPRSIRLMMSGLARLEDAIAAINGGQVFRFLLKPFRPEELLATLRSAAKTFTLERSHEQLLDELRQLNQNLEERVQQRTWELAEANRHLQQKNTMLERLALTDPLTGIPNRRAIDRLVRAEQRRRSRYVGALALGLIDADHFREINTKYLLPGGDHVLIALAQTLVDSVRAVDSVGRIGGEEFLVLAPETNREGAVILGERIRAAVEGKEIRYKENRIQVTVSIGFAVADGGDLSTYDQLRHVAAQALSEAKASGRNRCIIREVGASK